MTPQAVIFDIDGTLIDSVDLHAQAWVDAFAEFGIKVDFATARSQIGKGGDQLMPFFLSESDVARIGDELQHWRGEIFKARYLDQVKGFPDVLPLFQRILGEGKKIALGSSAKATELDHYKRLVGIQALPLVEVASDDVDKSKPHPDVFQVALERLGVKADAALVVGDTPHDAEAAKRAGIATVGVLCGGWPEDELRKSGCVAVFKDPADLLMHYSRSPFVGSVS